MEYLVIVLLLAVIVILAFRQPNKVKDAVITSTLDELKNKESEIVQGVYNHLPPSIKEKVDYKIVADLTSFVLNVGMDIVKSELKDK
jgi:hypothetical protein